MLVSPEHENAIAIMIAIENPSGKISNRAWNKSEVLSGDIR